MPRTTIAEVDSKRLVTVFGPRDQHLRRIRAALGVGVSARDDSIHIEGEESAVAQAAELRGGLREADASFKVVKNRLVVVNHPQYDARGRVFRDALGVARNLRTASRAGL